MSIGQAVRVVSPQTDARLVLLSQAGEVALPGRMTTSRSTFFGMRWTSQLVMLLFVSLCLTTLVLIALYELVSA